MSIESKIEQLTEAVKDLTAAITNAPKQVELPLKGKATPEPVKPKKTPEPAKPEKTAPKKKAAVPEVTTGQIRTAFVEVLTNAEEDDVESLKSAFKDKVKELGGTTAADLDKEGRAALLTFVTKELA